MNRILVCISSALVVFLTTGATWYLNVRPTATAGLTSPTDIAGLHLWLDARFGVETTTGVPAVDGNTVQVWKDQSGNGRDCSQASEGNRPTYRSTGVNGAQSVQFATGFDNALPTSTASASLKPFTVVTVVRPTSNSAADTMLGGNSSGAIQYRVGGSALELVSSGVALIGASSSGLSNNTTYITAVTYGSAGAYKFWINNAANGTGTNNLTFTAGRTVSIGTQVGEDFDGHICAVLLYDSVLGDSDLSFLAGYYNAIYAAY